MSILSGKKVIIIGDRDGIPGEAIKACVETVKDAEVLFASTECFVWTAAGAMDLENQKRIKEFNEKFGGENLVVLFGAAEAEATGLAAETVMIGDASSDVISAKEAGVTGIGVLWGYGDDKTNLIKNSDYVVKNTQELEEYLKLNYQTI